MENLITDSIKALEDGLSSLIERVKAFKFLPKNQHSKQALEQIIKRIEALPKYTEAELSTFVNGLNLLVQPVESELLALIDHFKETPKRYEHEIRAAFKALKYLPKMNKKEKSTLDLHFRCFPEHTEDELAALLAYIKTLPLLMEREIQATIETIKKLPLLSDAESDMLIAYIAKKELAESTKVGLTNFINRIVLIKQLYRLESIKHLEKESQEQLIALIGVIKKHIPKCSMLVLFGSYARGTEVVFDKRIESDGSRTTYQSDFDLMVVLPDAVRENKVIEIEGAICNAIEEEYDQLFLHKRHAPPQFIVERAFSLCENLKIHQPFFIDVIKDGIVLFDDATITLPEPKTLSYKIKKKVVEDYFNYSTCHAAMFITYAELGNKSGNYVSASFQIHQACEKYYRAIGMVFMNYYPKLHDLNKLVSRTKEFSSELATVFPCVTNFEQRAFKLLRDAYIDARYNIDFVVTKDDLAYMLARVDVLKDITHRICKERIAYYDMMAQKE